MRSENIQQHGEDVVRVTTQFQTEDVSPVPPTLDDIADALKNDTIYVSDEIKGALVKLLRIKELELFNFGPLTLDTVREAQQEAIDFVQHGYFAMPYRLCMLRGSVKYDNASVGTTLFTIEGEAETGSSVLEQPKKNVATIRVIKAKNHLFAMHSICTDRTQMQPEGTAIQVEIRQHEIDFWEKHLKNEDELQWQMSEGSLIMLGMTMIVNTKGVYKERLPRADKPNKARAAQGRPLIPQTTRVYTNVYNRAVQPGTGTHASPRPHRRRAHIRHYPATNTREAYVLPIAAMLVNYDGRPLEARKEYVVK